MTDLARRLSGLLDAFRADPTDYETNARLGALMFRVRRYQMAAEPHIRTALKAGRRDDLTPVLLDALAHIHLLKGDPEGAVDVLARARDQFPDLADLAYRHGDALFRAGRWDDAMALWTQSNKALLDQAGDPPVFRLEPWEVTCRFFGEQAAKIDLFLKARALGLLPAGRAHLLAPPDRVANSHLMTHWRAHLSLAETPADLPAAATPLYLDYIPLPDGRVLHRDYAHHAVQGMWEAAGRAPLLTATDDPRAAAGLPADAWWVALHVREPGFFDEDEPWNQNVHRNAAIADYAPAIRAVTDRGGWVVRLGDPSMAPLPPAERVIDYAHAAWRSARLDVDLIAGARLYVGMASGPTSTATAFGVPVLGTNWIHLGPWPLGRDAMVLPKRLRDRATGRILTLAECLQPPRLGALEPRLFERLGLDVLDNDPDDIADAVAEMLDGPAPDPDNARRQAAFRAQGDPLGVGPPPRCGAAFLRRHPGVLGALP